MASGMSIWKQAALSLIVGGVAIGAWYQQDALRTALGFAAESSGDRQNGQRRGGRANPVIVSRVDTGANTLSFDAVGTGRAQRSVMLRSEDSGKVVAMELAPGKQFKAGDVLMRLDDVEQELAVELARTRKEQADRILKRFEQLRQSGNAAVSRLDEVKSAADIARIELDQALAGAGKPVFASAVRRGVEPCFRRGRGAGRHEHRYRQFRRQKRFAGRVRSAGSAAGAGP